MECIPETWHGQTEESAKKSHMIRGYTMQDWREV